MEQCTCKHTAIEKEILAVIREMVDSKDYGHIIISMQNGKIGHMKKETSILLTTLDKNN